MCLMVREVIGEGGGQGRLAMGYPPNKRTNFRHTQYVGSNNRRFKSLAAFDYSEPRSPIRRGLCRCSRSNWVPAGFEANPATRKGKTGQSSNYVVFGL